MPQINTNHVPMDASWSSTDPVSPCSAGSMIHFTNFYQNLPFEKLWFSLHLELCTCTNDKSYCEMNALKRRATVTMIHILIHSDKPPPIQLSFEKYSMQFRHQIWQVSCRGWNHSHIQWSTSLCSSDYVMSCLCSLSLIHLESSASYCIHMSHLRSFL